VEEQLLAVFHAKAQRTRRAQREEGVGSTCNLFQMKVLYITMSRKTAHYNKTPQTATQKMLKAFFVNDLGNRQQATGNRQQATGNYTHNRLDRVNNLTAFISQYNYVSSFIGKTCPYGLFIKPAGIVRRFYISRKEIRHENETTTLY